MKQQKNLLHTELLTHLQSIMMTKRMKIDSSMQNLTQQVLNSTIKIHIYTYMMERNMLQQFTKLQVMIQTILSMISKNLDIEQLMFISMEKHITTLEHKTLMQIQLR